MRVDTLIRDYREAFTDSVPTSLNRLPAPRPGPTLDRCTQGPTATATPIVYRGWTLHVEPLKGRWSGYIANAEMTHCLFLANRADGAGNFETPQDADAALREMADEEEAAAQYRRERDLRLLDEANAALANACVEVSRTPCSAQDAEPSAMPNAVAMFDAIARGRVG